MTVKWSQYHSNSRIITQFISKKSLSPTLSQRSMILILTAALRLLTDNDTTVGWIPDPWNIFPSCQALKIIPVSDQNGRLPLLTGVIRTSQLSERTAVIDFTCHHPTQSPGRCADTEGGFRYLFYAAPLLTKQSLHRLLQPLLQHRCPGPLRRSLWAFFRPCRRPCPCSCASGLAESEYRPFNLKKEYIQNTSPRPRPRPRPFVKKSLAPHQYVRCQWAPLPSSGLWPNRRHSWRSQLWWTWRRGAWQLPLCTTCSALGCGLGVCKNRLNVHSKILN